MSSVAMIVLAAVVLGAVWRRWWGDARPSWAFGGYRALQAAIGVAALATLCLVAGHEWWSATIRAGVAIGFLAAMAESIPHVWRAWEWIDAEVIGLRSRHRLVDGYTTYAEAMAGGLVWAIAVAL